MVSESPHFICLQRPLPGVSMQNRNEVAAPSAIILELEDFSICTPSLSARSSLIASGCKYLAQQRGQRVFV